MGIISSSMRKSLPSGDFGLPGSRKFPMPNKAHAIDAEARATQGVKAGRLSSGQKAEIDAKAKKVLKK